VKCLVGAGGRRQWLQRSGVRRLAVLATVVAGIALTLASLPARAEAEPTPFTAHYDGRIAAAQGQSPTLVFQQAVAIGRGTFLPDSTAFFSHLLDVTPDPDEIVLGSFSILGVLGDMLVGNYEGQATSPDESGNSFFAGRFTVTDGKDRFAGAQGSGTLSGVINLLSSTLSVSLEGELLLPPAPAS
jgi:hypothetical protein